MQRSNDLHIPDNCFPRHRLTAVGVAAGLAGLLAAGGAGANCTGVGFGSGMNGPFKPAMYRPFDDAGAAFLATKAEDNHHVSMVGLWKVEFLAKDNSNGIPDGVLIDFGTATWYADGTETMVSGGRQPATGDVCMGAWEQTGRYTYKLNHLAMAYDGGVYVGPTSIREWVTVDASGKSFHGTFIITAYSATTVPGHEFDQSTVLAPTPIHGTIEGVRITAD